MLTGSYFLKRVVQTVPTLVVIVSLIFVLIHAAPGDPVTALAGEGGASTEFYERIRTRYGLDQPLPTQLLTFYTRVFRGDLGESIVYGRPVADVIFERMPASLLLMGTVLILSVLLGVASGVIAARAPESVIGQFTTAITAAGQSIPIFWLCQLLMLGFSVELKWFPLQGMESVRLDLHGWRRAIDIAHHLVLPAASLTLINLALIGRLARSSMLEVLELDYIRVARSKGIGEHRVLLRHALKNAILPVVTLIGMQAGVMLAGAVLTETVFSWPGLGRLLYDAILSRDYPILLGLFFLVSLTVIVANLVTDFAYTLLDPRVRLE